MILPVVKLGTLALKTFCKPIANRLKKEARLHPKFRQFIINIAQVLFPPLFLCLLSTFIFFFYIFNLLLVLILPSVLKYGFFSSLLSLLDFLF